ncbi:angiopoietin-2-like [Mercenaria mercenaria]|uniref:angiopoietin-2-like n=1 Tax=Mercenaria mercenaria TaxID=6596 RepID=UPI00234EF412|nr:angiopoietin-2-like [Mercenaria mercenaria]
MRICVDLALFLYINSVCGFTSNHFMERLNYIEDRINVESKFRRDDFSTLFNEIGSVKSMLQQLMENKAEGQNNVDVQTTYKTDSEVVEQVLMLTKGFEEEKILNTRFRREIPELQKQVQNLKFRTDQISASLEDILNGIEFLKNHNREREETFNLLENEIPKLKKNIQDLHDEIQQTKALESENFDRIKNNSEELKENIEHLKHAHELCLENIDKKINLTKKLEEKFVYRENFTKTDSKTEYNKCDCSFPSGSVASTHASAGLKTTYSSCLELYENGFKSNDVYVIAVDQERKVSVYCDMTTDNGGWTVFQRRQDGFVNFYQNWNAYKIGFGILTGEFWLGNEYLSLMTENDEPHELRIDLEDHDGNHAFAKYSSFKVRSGRQNYKLEVRGYTGNAGDSLISSDTGYGPHNEMEFTTKDRDNDNSSNTNCASLWKGAWWFNQCYDSHLNGPYRYKPKCKKDYKCVIWYTWKGSQYFLKFTEMKFR